MWLPESQIITGMMDQIKQGIIVKAHTTNKRNSSSSDAAEKAMGLESKT